MECCNGDCGQPHRANYCYIEFHELSPSDCEHCLCLRCDAHKCNPNVLLPTGKEIKE